jgi:dethiobiotin synthetase
MKRSVLFVTGTDTGVGKTVFASVLARHLSEQGVRLAALKPVCAGDRNDARELRAAAGNALPLGEVNPWHFRPPLSPLLAARMERRRVTQAQVVARVRAVARRFELVVVEGAGGLLSPLGEGFDSRDLIAALRATPIVVCPNRLGAVNQILLVLKALPRAAANRTQIVLVNPPRMDLAARTNPKLLAEFVEKQRVHALAWLGNRPFSPAVGHRPAICRTLDRLVRAVGSED